MEWLNQFSTVAVNGVPLLLLVIALTQFVKQLFSIQDLAVRGLALLLGFALGLGYQLSQLMPVDWVGWFAAIVWSIGLGIAALGAYDAARNVASSAIRRFDSLGHK